jgi:predicted aconitase with swiveling domain
LSLWGGFDLETGSVCDIHHPQYGAAIAGKVLIMPGGRGSSSSSSILLESARLGQNPLAIAVTDKDPIIVMGALVSADLYKVHIPVILIEADCLDRFASGELVEVEAQTGCATISSLAGQDSGDDGV